MEELLGKVHCVDCIEFMNSLPEECLDLMVTSPPYNVGIQYETHEDTMTYEEYIAWLDEVWSSLYRVMKDHSYVVVNIGRNTQFNTPAHIAAGLEKAGFKFYKSIQWLKPKAAAHVTFWYRNPYPRYYEPYLVTEDILVYTKGEVKGDFRGERMEILDPEFVKAVDTNVWKMQPESFKVADGIHPAPFPVEFPSRCIQLFSLPGEVVYDPFGGSGTTLLAARDLCRKYVGTDVCAEYCDYANNTLAAPTLWG